MNLSAPNGYIFLSDVHGAFYTLTRLLNAAPKGVQLVFGGDLIDRGPHSRQVVEMAMENNVPTCIANHEDLALAFYRRKAHCPEMYEHEIWLQNGGKKTLLNWPVKWREGVQHPETRRNQRLGGAVPSNVLDWMEQLPPYYTTDPDPATGRRALFSHTGFGLDADVNPETETQHWFRALWGNYLAGDGYFATNPDGTERDDGWFRAFGHQRVQNAVVTDRYAAVDTGAAYPAPFGTLSALLWPSKVVLTQAYDESPITPAFIIQSGGLLT